MFVFRVLIVLALSQQANAELLYTVVDLDNLNSQVNSIGTNYPGGAPSCKPLNQISINPEDQSLGFGQENCTAKFYRGSGYKSAYTTTRTIEKFDFMYKPVEKDFMSLGTQHCPRRLWAVACSGNDLDGQCAMSDGSGSFDDLNRFGLGNKVKSYMFCSSKSSCSSIVKGTIVNLADHLSNRIIAPCFNELKSMSAPELEVSLKDILSHVADQQHHYYEQHKTSLKKLALYWQGVQKRKQLNAVLNKIPSESLRSKELSDQLEALKEKTGTIELYKSNITAALKTAKNAKISASTARHSFTQLVESGFNEIEQTPSSNFEGKVNLIEETKWKIINNSKDLKLKVNAALTDLTAVLSACPALKEEGHELSGAVMGTEFASDVTTLNTRLEQFEKDVSSLIGKLKGVLNSIDSEVVSYQNKLEAAIQTSIQEASDIELAERMKVTHYLSAANAFHERVNQQIKVINEKPSTSGFYERPFLSELYEKHLDLVDFIGICDQKVEKWMQRGCNVIDMFRDDLAHQMNRYFPSTLNNSLAIMKGLKIEPEAVAELEELAKSKRWREAFARHDNIIRRWEAVH